MRVRGRERLAAGNDPGRGGPARRLDPRLRDRRARASGGSVIIGPGALRRVGRAA